MPDVRRYLDDAAFEAYATGLAESIENKKDREQFMILAIDSIMKYLKNEDGSDDASKCIVDFLKKQKVTTGKVSEFLLNEYMLTIS